MATWSSSIMVGSLVWVEDPHEAYIDGKVLEIEHDKIKIQCTSKNELIMVELSKVFPKDMEAPPGGVDDMIKLSYLHEPGVLQNLATRYELDQIYTYAGNILISVNPYKELSHLYEDMMEQYKGAAFRKLSPHVFAVADAAYRAMIEEGKNQSIVVSGESGVGKTETTKMIMKYLTYLAGGPTGIGGNHVEQKILQANRILEAFGNAKTVRNNNSSRFGKFVEIQFDKYGRISGAAVKTFLLEISRVCRISNPERNYHCFYYLCAAPYEDKKNYELGEPQTFHYLNQSKCFKLDGDGIDAKKYIETRKAMTTIGIEKHDQEAIFRLVAAVLHLGNIDFAMDLKMDSSVISNEKSRFHLKMAADLFMCDAKGLEDALITRVMETPGERITKTLNTKDAIVRRDVLAKTIYFRLFLWLVRKINSSIGQDPISKLLIGVLDIFGFETFNINSFEQFCINFTNEKLQQHFNQHVFKTEQAEYNKEEIEWSYIEFVDNQDVIDLIEKKPGGIIPVLDEHCMLKDSTPDKFARSLNLNIKNNKRFKAQRLPPRFTIEHYAGEVTYQAGNFLEKNKDYIVAQHQTLLNGSKCTFVANLFPPRPQETPNSSKFSSVASRFKEELKKLMETLDSTQPHYVICIKPNNDREPGKFKRSNVNHQLRFGGVYEAIRINCVGYPTRRTLDEFLQQFALLASEDLDVKCNAKAACRKILDKMGLKDYQLGKTKVFLRAGQMAELNARRAEVLDRAARPIQRKIRLRIARKKNILCEACILLQSYCRGRLAHMLYMRNEAAAITLQAWLRAMAARRIFRIKKQHNEAASLIETKTKEIAELQEQLHAMQLQVDEVKAMLINKCQVAWKAIEEALSLITRKPEDVEKIDALTTEVERLKTLLIKIEEATGAANSIRDNEILERVGTNFKEIQDTVQRLEEKISDLKADNSKNFKQIVIAVAFLGACISFSVSQLYNSTQ